MLEQNEIDKIKETALEFFEKMTITVSDIEISQSSEKKDIRGIEEVADVVALDVQLDEPQILIGQGGQTLFEIQRLLRSVLNKRFKNIFYLNLDINGYKKKKVDYLKEMVKDVADQVSSTKKEKALSPMSSYERRIVHAELSERSDVTTESRGDGFDRHIVIKPK
jgi:spoIIIJ-associated protein